MTQERLLVEVLRDICGDQGYRLKEMSHGWLVRIERGHSVNFVFGYDVGLNSSSASQVVNDKSTAFEALHSAGIPAIEHVLFHAPRMVPYVSPDGNWRLLLELFEKWNSDVVCKPHMGTGGDQVLRASSRRELEEVVHVLFQANRALTISPYYEFPDEFRVIILEDEARLVFRKERHHVVGDGISTVAALISLSDPGSSASIPDLAYVPAAGEKVVLEWRHNLGQGARAVTVSPDDNKEVVELARTALQRLGLAFASVDIAAGAELKVLEINSGVMLDRFASFSPANRRASMDLYRDAINRALETFPPRPIS